MKKTAQTAATPLNATSSTALQLTFRPDGIALLTIDVPGEKVNTLRAEFAQQLTALLQQIQSHTGLRGVIILSGKPDGFIAGADIHMLDKCHTADQAQELAQQGQRLFEQLAKLPVPVVAAIHGACLGGGLELALACHYRVCTLEDKTVLGLPEVQLGLLPGSGGTQRLPRLVGLGPALDMMLTGRQIRARQALKMGLVDAAVPLSILLDVAVQQITTGKKNTVAPSWSMRLINNSLGWRLLCKLARKKVWQKSRGHYPAPEQILRVVELGLHQGMEIGLQAEAKAFGELVMTPESVALRGLFFASTALKKRHHADVSVINRIGVLGGGLMGSGIAYVSVVKQGAEVRIKDVTQDGVCQALRYSWQLLESKAKRGHLRRQAQQRQMMQLSGGTDYTGFAGVQVVIEAVFEDLALKRQMVADIEQNTSPTTIFASNTSSLPIGQIAEGAQRPAQIIGLHYFSPVDKMPLVEVIPHANTSTTAINTIVAMAYKQGKTPIVVADKAGFYVNRILAPYVNEAARCLLAGEPIEEIDQALVNFGFPVGPITLLDEVGIDIGTRIVPILVAELGERFSAPAAFDAILADGRKGKKNGKGFYLYNNARWRGNRKSADPQIYTLLGIKPQAQLGATEIAERCTLLMLNEAARCLAEGVIASAQDGDIGAVFGIGFPPFLGGPFRYMDHLGAATVVEKLTRLAKEQGERFAPCESLCEMANNGSYFYPR